MMISLADWECLAMNVLVSVEKRGSVCCLGIGVVWMWMKGEKEK